MGMWPSRLKWLNKQNYHTMNITEFLQYLAAGNAVKGGSEMHLMLHALSQEAIKITAKLNGGYHSPEEIRTLFSQLTGKPVDESFGLFPPFYTDCGKNIKVGKNVFINACCNFQDQGGITIGDGSLIGHNVVLATLNHGIAPESRHNLLPAPIVIGKNVWIGSHATVLAGVTVGDNAV